MLVFNGLKYAKNESEFTNSLFESGGTCNGFYKVVNGGIRLMDMQGEVRAFIAKNDGGFVVSARRVPSMNNRIRYMFGTMDDDEQWLGINGMSLREERNECSRVFEELSK